MFSIRATLWDLVFSRQPLGYGSQKASMCSLAFIIGLRWTLKPPRAKLRLQKSVSLLWILTGWTKTQTSLNISNQLRFTKQARFKSDWVLMQQF